MVRNNIDENFFNFIFLCALSFKVVVQSESATDVLGAVKKGIAAGAYQTVIILDFACK